MTPEEARELWAMFFNAPSDEDSDWARTQLFHSVLVDHITNRIVKDDEYAVVIGERIATLADAIVRKRGGL